MSRGGTGSVFLSRRQPEVIAESGCNGTFECAIAMLGEHVFVLTSLLLLVVVAVGSLVFLPRARELCARERKRTRAEYEAFDRFLARVRPMSPRAAMSESSPADQQLLLQQSPGSDDDLTALRTAYEETVLAVPHFEEEYDETPVEHMREELSDEIAEAVMSGSTLGEPLHRSILDAAVAARDRRGRFLEMLDNEAESLASHADELSEISRDVEEITAPLCADQSFDELREQRRKLTDHEGRIEAIVNRRQQDRTETRRKVLRSDPGFDLQTYLYKSMEPTYPVLAEATNIIGRISVGLRRVEDELIYRS